MNISLRNTIRWALIALAAPIFLIILLAVLLYLPPVQNWAVDCVADYASEKTGMQISVGRVNLEFPLDLGVENFKMIKPNDSLPQVRDTVADVEKLVVSVQLMPLLSRQVEIDQLELRGVNMNTTDFIHEARVKGTVGLLSLSSHGIDWGKQTIIVDDALLSDANVSVELSDTVPPDTTKTPTYWKIHVEQLNVDRTRAVVHMPGDTLQVDAYLGKAGVREGTFDLYKNLYSVGNFELADGRIAYDNKFMTRSRDIIDPNHILLSEVNLGIDSLSYAMETSELKLVMRHCALKERGGLQIADIKGPLSMDSLKLKMPQLLLKTPDSWLKAAVDMDLNAFSDSCPGRLSLRANASLGKRDLMRFMSGMPASFRRQWPDKPLTVNTILSGNLQRMRLRLLNLNLPSALKADANGYLTNLTDTKRLGASINFKASAANTQLITALVGKENLGGAKKVCNL